MSRERVASLLAGAVLIAATPAHPHGLSEAPATLVAVSVQIDGQPASLYPAPDGSGRYYLEARAGSRYAVHLAVHERKGREVFRRFAAVAANAIA